MERYSDEIVSSMTEAVRTAALQAKARSVVLVGYSGGGVLAVLIAERLDNVAAVITVGANLDTRRVDQASRLSAAVRLAESCVEHGRASAGRRYIYMGRETTVVPPATAEAYFERYPARAAARSSTRTITCAAGSSSGRTAVARDQLLLPRAERDVREIREHAVDAERVELPIFAASDRCGIRARASRARCGTCTCARAGRRRAPARSRVVCSSCWRADVAHDLPLPRADRVRILRHVFETSAAQLPPRLSPYCGMFTPTTRLPLASYCKRAVVDAAARAASVVLARRYCRFALSNDWMNTGPSGPIELALAQRLEQPVLERQAEREMERRMLGLRIDADRAAALRRLALGQVENFFERRNLEAAVVLLRARRIRLHRAQLLDLGEREVAGEESRSPPCRRASSCVRRSANCGRDFTSVVSSSSGSWRATR